MWPSFLVIIFGVSYLAMIISGPICQKYIGFVTLPILLSLCQSDEDGNFLFVAPRSPLSSPTIWEVFTPKLCFKRLQLKTTFAQTCSNQIHLYFHQCIWIGNRAKFKVKSCCGFRLCENFSDRSVIEIWLLGGRERKSANLNVISSGKPSTASFQMHWRGDNYLLECSKEEENCCKRHLRKFSKPLYLLASPVT